MQRETQHIASCTHCGRVFADGEDYWQVSIAEGYCEDNGCNWEDEYYKDNE